jgi:GTP-binding protein
LTMSALARTNLGPLLTKAVRELASAPAPASPSTASPVYRPAEDPRDFRVDRESDHRWRLSGIAIERAAAMTYWEHEGSVRRFQKLMQSIGVDDALRKSGIQEGDTVAIGDYELDWQE